ncbi:MAG: hypothetical protein ACI9S8_002293 [Chlamydiales bacterium]|jgi:hypothetical protein
MKALGDVTVDSKGRVSLGARHAGERYIITEEMEGRFILEKAVIIPEREVWLHKNKKAKESVLKGLEQAKQGRLKKNVINLDDNGNDDE